MHIMIFRTAQSARKRQNGIVSMISSTSAMKTITIFTELKSSLK